MKKQVQSILLHSLAWFVLLILPFFIFPNARNFPGVGDMPFRYIPIIINGAFLMGLFYLNYYVLIPRFYFRKKYFLYFLICALSISLILIIPHFLFGAFGNGRMFPPPIPNGSGPIAFGKIPSPINVMPLQPPLRNGGVPFAIRNTLLMYMVAFFASIFLRVNNQLKISEQDIISSKLLYLKSQINPHFLFNTLNSIYSVAIGKAPEVAEMVEKLSSMMRYTLHDTQKDFIELKEEIDYIKNYIELQRIRYDKNVVFNINIEGDVEDKQIAPLLLIPFIENAFKHGVNAEENSEISIHITSLERVVFLVVKNNIVKIDDVYSDKSGIGVENTKHRLEIIYPSKHNLVISNNGLEHSVELMIKIA